MPHRFNKMHELVSRVQRARTVTRAFQLASLQDHQPHGSGLYWPDLIKTVETILPTSDELDAALDELHEALPSASAAPP